MSIYHIPEATLPNAHPVTKGPTSAPLASSSSHAGSPTVCTRCSPTFAQDNNGVIFGREAALSR